MTQSEKPEWAKELLEMFAAFERDWIPSVDGLGQWRCRRKLSDGTIVMINIKRPNLKPLSSKKSKV